MWAVHVKLSNFNAVSRSVELAHDRPRQAATCSSMTIGHVHFESSNLKAASAARCWACARCGWRRRRAAALAVRRPAATPAPVRQTCHASNSVQACVLCPAGPAAAVVLACSLVTACEYALSSIPRFLILRGSKPRGPLKATTTSLTLLPVCSIMVL